MAEFKPGDIVRLNSGSPALTVVSVENETVAVTWVSAEGVQSHRFPAACLRSH